MKIGLTLPHLNRGGIETGMVRLLGALQGQEFDFTVYLQHHEGALLAQIPQGIETVDLQGAGVRGGAARLAKRLRAHPVDILWSATNAANLLNLLAARKLAGPAPQVIVGEHIPLNAFLETRKTPWLRRLLMRGLYPKANAIAAPLQPILDEHHTLLGRRCPPCTVLPNPVVDHVVHDKPLAQTAQNFVTLGRLSSEKGYDLAIDAFALLADRLPHSNLTLFGEGDARGALLSQIAAHGLEKRIHLAGPVDGPADALAQADMLWCTSHVEGFGNVLVEAQAAGVPVASVDCPFGPVTILENGRAGCLVKGRDAAGFAGAVYDFACDHAARHAAQTRGRAVSGRYTTKASVDAHSAFFRSFS